MYTNRYNAKEDEPTIYCTPSRYANATPQRRYTTNTIYYIIMESSTLTVTT